LIKSNIQEMDYVSHMIIHQSREGFPDEKGTDSDKPNEPMMNINNNAKMLSRLINKLSSLATQFKVDTTSVPAYKDDKRVINVD
jgi:hypothetical protein